MIMWLIIFFDSRFFHRILSMYGGSLSQPRGSLGPSRLSPKCLLRAIQKETFRQFLKSDMCLFRQEYIREISVLYDAMKRTPRTLPNIGFQRASAQSILFDSRFVIDSSGAIAN